VRQQLANVSCRVFSVLRFSGSYSDDDQDSPTIHEDGPVLRAALAFCNLRKRPYALAISLSALSPIVEST